MRLDQLDARIITLMTEEPRIGLLEVSRRLSVARGTVQARFQRLLTSGVITSLAPTVDPAAIGYSVQGFVTAEIAQGKRQGGVITHLLGIPEVLEVHTTTGPGDLLIRVVALSNRDLQRVIDKVVEDPDILRTSTVIILESSIEPRTLPLVQAAVSSSQG